jgi:hypothetical protein
MTQERLCLDVTLGTSEDKLENVVVLSGMDLYVPLEADLDGDPFHDDILRLESADGRCWILNADEPAVGLDLDRKLHVYTFRGVPPGLYKISVKLSDDVWSTVVSGIVVNKKGALLGGKELTDQEPKAIPPDPSAKAQPAPSLPVEKDFGEIIDEDIFDRGIF